MSVNLGDPVVSGFVSVVCGTRMARADWIGVVACLFISLARVVGLAPVKGRW